jgi:hypothetical protein
VRHLLLRIPTFSTLRSDPLRGAPRRHTPSLHRSQDDAQDIIDATAELDSLVLTQHTPAQVIDTPAHSSAAASSADAIVVDDDEPPALERPALDGSGPLWEPEDGVPPEEQRYPSPFIDSTTFDTVQSCGSSHVCTPSSATTRCSVPCGSLVKFIHAGALITFRPSSHRSIRSHSRRSIPAASSHPRSTVPMHSK